MYDDIEYIIERYENGEINIYYQFEDIVNISIEDRKKYNIKPFFDWNLRPVIAQNKFNSFLIDFVKQNNLPTLFFLDVRNLLIRGFCWEQAVIYFHNNRKPLHPKIRQLLLQKKRGYIKEN